MFLKIKKYVKEILVNYIPAMLDCVLFVLCLIFVILALGTVVDGTEKEKFLVNAEIIDIQKYQKTYYKKNVVTLNTFCDVTVKLNNDKKVRFMKVPNFSNYDVGDSVKLQCIKVYVYDKYFETQYEILEE